MMPRTAQMDQRLAKLARAVVATCNTADHAEALAELLGLTAAMLGHDMGRVNACLLLDHVVQRVSETAPEKPLS